MKGRNSWIEKISDNDYAVFFSPFRGCDKTRHFKTEKSAQKHQEKINRKYKTSLSIMDII